MLFVCRAIQRLYGLKETTGATMITLTGAGTTRQSPAATATTAIGAVGDGSRWYRRQGQAQALEVPRSAPLADEFEEGGRRGRGQRHPW